MTLVETKTEPEETGENPSLNALFSMLRTRRPCGTRTEKRFIRDWIAPLGTKVDSFGNHHLRIGEAPILWSCHTDTVHTTGGLQKLVRTSNGCGVKVDASSKSNCLGADDTAGIWLMREMILAKVPGLYVFHREEEVGCKGSHFIADKTPELLKDIKYAIAFDRKGYDEVITHQMSRTCSDDFAKSMSGILGLGYKPSDRGVLTDTKTYSGLIGECTNIGVGYFNQHSSTEWLDVYHVFALRKALLDADFTKLVESRKPGEKDPKDYSYYSYGYDGFDGFGEYGGHYGGSYGNRTYNYHKPSGAIGTSYYDTKTNKLSYVGYDKGIRGVWSRDRFDEPWEFTADANVTGSNLPATVLPQNRGKPRLRVVPDENPDMDQSDEHLFREGASLSLENLVKNHPEEVADLLECYGINAQEVADHIYETSGFVKY